MLHTLANFIKVTLRIQYFDYHIKFVKKNECKRKCSLDLEELVVAGLIKRGHRRTIINQRVSHSNIQNNLTWFQVWACKTSLFFRKSRSLMKKLKKMIIQQGLSSMEFGLTIMKSLLVSLKYSILYYLTIWYKVTVILN